MSNWEKQIEDHVSPGALTSCVYYGKTRSMTPAELKRYDIVITTYQTVTQEHDLSMVGKGGAPLAKKQKTDQGLFGVGWKVGSASCVISTRIISDKFVSPIASHS